MQPKPSPAINQQKRQRMNITVYLSSKTNIDPDFSKAVEDLGKGIGAMKARLIYGGSNAGQMHLLATTAKAAGATVTGIIPETFRHIADPVVDEMIYTLDLNERKNKLIALGQIYVALPGGIGTLDEVMATLAEMTIARKYTKPIILINVKGLFNPFIEQLKKFTELNLADPEAVNVVKVVNTADECINLIKTINS